MAHAGTMIPAALMYELGEYGAETPLALWVVAEFKDDFMALGLYARIVGGTAKDDGEPGRVTVSKEWAEMLMEGDLKEDMAKLMKAGAITKVATYRSGKMRFAVEKYPPHIRAEMEAYRRPDGRLVVAFA